MPGSVVSGIGDIFGGSAEKGGLEQARRVLQEQLDSAINDLRSGARGGESALRAGGAGATGELRRAGDRVGGTLSPFANIGLLNLQRASEFADPESQLAQRERDAFARTLGQNLRARGLTGSGTEIAGLTDFELGLARQRRDLTTNLGAIGAKSAGQLGQLQAMLAQSLSNVPLQTGLNLANLRSGLGSGLANLRSGFASNLANIEIGKGLATAGQIRGPLSSLSDTVSGGASFLGNPIFGSAGS